MAKSRADSGRFQKVRRIVKARGGKGKFHALRKSGGGYKIIAKSTGKPLSKKPISRAKALAQLGAIEAAKHGGFKGGK